MKILLLVTKIASLIGVGICTIFLIMWQIAPRDTDELLKNWNIPLTYGKVLIIGAVFSIVMFTAIFIDNKYFNRQ